MIEEVALPPNGGSFRSVFLPLRDRVIHRTFDWKGREHVEVIGHEDKQVNVHNAVLLPESKALNERLCDFGIAQLVLMAGTAAYRQEVDRARCNPSWNLMW